VAIVIQVISELDSYLCTNFPLIGSSQDKVFNMQSSFGVQITLAITPDNLRFFVLISPHTRGRIVVNAWAQKTQKQ